MTFTEAKNEFDSKYGTSAEYDCFLPVHLIIGKKTSLKKKNGQHNEEYYKWQFLYSIVYSGMYGKDNIGTEVQFPKGNKSSVRYAVPPGLSSVCLVPFLSEMPSRCDYDKIPEPEMLSEISAIRDLGVINTYLAAPR